MQVLESEKQGCLVGWGLRFGSNQTLVSAIHGQIWSTWCILKSCATHDVFKEVKGFAVIVEINGKLSDARSMCCSHAQRFSMYHFGHGNCLPQVLSQTSMCQLLLGRVTCAEWQRIHFNG